MEGVGGDPKDLDEDRPVRGFLHNGHVFHVGPEQTAENAGRHLPVASYKCS